MTNNHTNHASTTDARPSKAWTVALWCVQGLLALAFLAAGGSKIAGAEPMVENFDKVGMGQWFRVLTGVLEVAGAVALLVPRAAFYGALLLACVMAGAVVAHLATPLGGSPAAPIVLGVLAAAVAYFRRP